MATLKTIASHGQLGALPAIAARRYGQRTGLIDEQGSLTFEEMYQRSEQLAATLARRGLSETDTVGVLCRNHRGFLDITFAAARLGARILYLNTDFAAPELRDVCQREAVTLLVLDDEFRDLTDDLELAHGRYLAWHDHSPTHDETLEDLIHAGVGLAPVGPPPRDLRVVLLTSGTSGTPKGANRHAAPSLAPVAMLAKVPFRTAEATYVAPPMYHGVGFSQMLLCLALGCTVITERRFDPARVAAAVTAHRPTTLVLVPVMLRRLLGVLERSLNRYDLSSLRIVFASGSALEPELVRRAQVTLGPVLYNFYGSTELGFVSFATPEDLRAAPGSAGRPAPGIAVAIYDGDDARVRDADTVGRIYVANAFGFAGYTGGGSKDVIDGLMSTGDLGHFDADGRLWVDGRDDDMVVSGGENLFPSQVEELLATHPAVEEAAVIGVEDEEFGRRLAAFVVLGPDQPLSADQVREFVKANLARFKVPRDVYFLPELPRNPTGKVLKRDLRELHQELSRD